MTVSLYKLVARTYMYTMSIVGLAMESALEVLEERTPKPVLEMSPSEMLLSKILSLVSELKHGRYSQVPPPFLFYTLVG